jgi:hypothetical protein
MSVFNINQPPTGTPAGWQPAFPVLTFGVEIEFVLVAPIPSDADPAEAALSPDHPIPTDLTLPTDPSDHRRDAWHAIQTRVSEALEDANIPAYCAECKAYWAVHPDDLDPKAWMVKVESTIRDSETRYGFYGLELNTPVFLFQESNLTEISQVCDILKSNFRVHTNQSCGLHVHIGNGNEGFDLPTLQKLAAFLWCFESQLNQIHPKHRLDSDWTIALERSELMKTLHHQREKRRKPGLDHIFGTLTINGLVGLMKTFDRGAYFFGLQARPFPQPKKRTIEFRAHEGTLDGVRIGHWVRVCEGLVRYARDTSIADVERFCRRNVDRPIEGDGIGDQGCSLWKVLMRIGCHDQADFYCARNS